MVRESLSEGVSQKITRELNNKNEPDIRSGKAFQAKEHLLLLGWWGIEQVRRKAVRPGTGAFRVSMRMVED